MTLFQLIKPLVVAAGLGLLYGRAQATGVPPAMLALALASGMIAGIALLRVIQLVSERAGSISDGKALAELVVTIVGVPGGMWLVGTFAMTIGHRFSGA